MTAPRIPRLSTALAALVLAGSMACGTPTAPTQEPVEAQAVERPSPDYSTPPQGYMTSQIEAAVIGPTGPLLLLRAEAYEGILPISISMGQLMAIDLRRSGRDFERPLTHDLVEDMITTLDGEVGKVQVDALREGTFYATIFLIGATEIHEIDARPSDAIALAAGRDIPIYIAESVLEQAGITDEELDELPPADPGDPEDYDDSPTTPL